MSAELWFAIVSLALGVIGAGFSALASVIAYFVKKGEDAQDRTIGELKSDHVLLRKDVEDIGVTLAKYETHIGAGDARIKEIRDSISDHVTKEEQIFWKKVEAISEAQRVFAEAVLQRITSMEARLPNGELKELVIAVTKLQSELELLKGLSQSAVDHVKEHNTEAEDWKRRIVALESRGRVSGKK